jgi:hypothetical protein
VSWWRLAYNMVLISPLFHNFFEKNTLGGGGGACHLLHGSLGRKFDLIHLLYSGDTLLFFQETQFHLHYLLPAMKLTASYTSTFYQFVVNVEWET